MKFFGKLLGKEEGNFKTIVKEAPNKVGVYLVELDSRVVYVGRAIENRPGQYTSGLRKRLQEHFRGANTGKREMFEHRDKINVTIKPCDSVEKAKNMEARLIRKYNTVKNGWNDKYED